VSGIGSAILYQGRRSGRRPASDPDEEREGLDISDHGERAYNY